MCFSPEVSFAASGILSALGIAAIYKTQNDHEKLLASIPLFFGIQQFTEGILWLVLIGKINPMLAPYATYIYLFFVQIFWPIWIPISIIAIEKNKKYKNILNASLVFGIAIASGLAYSLIKYGAIPSIEGHHIFYQIHTLISQTYCLILYLISITLPFFISGRKSLRFFGILVLTSLAATYLFYYHWLTSIWCFFAALLSCFIFWAITKKKI